MIPFVTVTDIPGSPFPPFGTLIGLGIVIGLLRAIQVGAQRGIRARTVIDLCIFVILPAYLGSHVLLVVFYHPDQILSDPWILLRFDQGISAFGGLVSAVIAFVAFLRITGEAPRWLVLGDIVVQGFIVGWIFGRLGCTITHDHPGVVTDFVLAVRFPDGPRHDLGLYELLFTFLVLLPVSFWINRREFPDGTQIVVFSTLYGLFRLFADDLRILDTRYFGLTPGQYGSFVLFVIAAGLYAHLRRSTH